MPFSSGIDRTTEIPVEFAELADKKIESSVVVIVKPDCARTPSGDPDAGLLRNIGKCSISIIAIQNVSSVIRHVDVWQTVAVVVANGNAHPVTSASNPGLLRDIGEGPVSIVAVERIAERLWGIIKVALPAVDEIYVHPSVVVVVKKSAPRATALRQILHPRFSGGVYPMNPAAGRGDFFEERSRSREPGDTSVECPR